MDALLAKIKLALRITTDAFDSELTDLVNACLADMGFAGISADVIGADIFSDSAVVMAITTYCKINFGKLDGAEYDRLKKSYDEQKAQMGMATGYTEWSA